MTLYHATTERKARLYRERGRIMAPVRGFTTLQGAMAWAVKVGRKVIVQFETTAPAHKLSDHHNQWGEAWWTEGDVTTWKCVFSAEKDA